MKMGEHDFIVWVHQSGPPYRHRNFSSGAFVTEVQGCGIVGGIFPDILKTRTIFGLPGGVY